MKTSLCRWVALCTFCMASLVLSLQAAAEEPAMAYEPGPVLSLGPKVPMGVVVLQDGERVLVLDVSREGGVPTLQASVWNRNTGVNERRLRPRPALQSEYPAAITPDGRWLAYLSPAAQGGFVEAMVIVDLERDEEVGRIPVRQGKWPTGLAISPDGKRVAAVLHDVNAWGNPPLHVWDAGSGRALMEANGSGVDDLAFSTDGRRVLALGTVAELWDIESRQRVARARRAGFVFGGGRISPDGRFFATVNPPDSVSIWDVATGREVLGLQGVQRGHRTVEFSPDGARLVTAGFDQRIRVWDARSGAAIAVLEGHGAYVGPDPNGSVEQNVLMASFDPTGSLLVSAGGDGTVRLWDDAMTKRETDLAAFRADLPLAQGNDTGAMHRVALAYRDGRGVERNAALATQWLTQAADGGHGPANLELADALMSGDAGRQDCVAGGQRLNKAVSSGSAEAGARLDAVLSPLGGREGAAALSPQIQADLLEAQIIEVLTRQDYPAFLANLCALEALGHADRLPIEARRELVYHRAAGLRAAGKPRAALAALNQYLNEAGNSGASYTAAIQMLRPLQQEAK